MNFEEISKKVRKFSKDTMTEVQKMNEVRQLNSKVNEEKKYLNKLYLEAGKKLYDKYKDSETPLEGFEADFRKITERYSVMDLLQDEIRKVKGVVLCPCCNMEVAATERFCSNCGNRMPESIKIEGKENAEVIDSADTDSDTEKAEDTAGVVVDVEAEDVTETVEEVKEAAEEVSGEDVGEAAEEVLEAAEETSEATSEEIAEEEQEKTSEENPAETAPADKTDEVAAEADEAAAAKAAQSDTKAPEEKE